MFKFGQRLLQAKTNTDIFTIGVNKVVISDKVSCNNGKDCCYTAGYQVDEALIPLFIKIPKKLFSYCVSQYDKKSAQKIPFNVFEATEWVFQCKKIWNEVESQLFVKLTTGPIKGESRYAQGKLKMWKGCITTNFHDQDVPYDMCCNATALLKIDSVYKQGKSYHPQVYVEKCKYNNAENRQCNMLRDDDDNVGFFDV